MALVSIPVKANIKWDPAKLDRVSIFGVGSENKVKESGHKLVYDEEELVVWRQEIDQYYVDRMLEGVKCFDYHLLSTMVIEKTTKKGVDKGMIGCPEAVNESKCRGQGDAEEVFGGDTAVL